MKTPKAEDVKRGIGVLWETLQCPICLDLMTTPVSTKCDHQFCKFCMLRLLDSTKQKEANCPVCKTKITKRNFQESPGFQRIIAGLRDMIQAYEHDTCTNYAPGTGLDDEENEDYVNLSGSHSSTVAAKHGFASLMGLEDSSAFTTEHEGLDKKTHSHMNSSPNTCYLEPETELSEVVEKATSRPQIRGKKRITEFEDPSSHLILIQDEKQHRPLRQSSRNNKVNDLEPDKILKQRQKKSLEKVSEWLMKVPPTEGNSELERDPEDSSDSEHSACPTESCSSTSTAPGNQDNSDVTPKREGRAKGLEEQVFGAVYKRGRRSKRSFSPKQREYVDPPAPSPRERPRSPRRTPKRKKSSDLTPADFVKISCFEDKDKSPAEEQTPMKEQTNDTANGISKETEQMFMDVNDNFNSIDEHGEESEKLPENDNNKGKDDGDGPVFDIVLHEPERKLAKRRRDTLQNVDEDLQQQTTATVETIEKRRTVKKKGKRLQKAKSVRVPKPLVLVGIGEGECNPVEIPKTRSEEIQVLIESYPTSEDLGSPVTRSTRSRSLQVFTEKLQESNKKKARASKNTSDNKRGANSVKQPEETKASTSDDVTCSQNENVERFARRNGCVCDVDIGGIEKMESSESLSHLKAADEAKQSTAEVPNTGSPCEGTVAFYAATVPSPAEATVPNSVLECVTQANSPSNDVPLENAQLEASACQNNCAEMNEEEDRNDSELDTEQLLKSFRATKRKSFHLGSPNTKTSRIGSVRENLQSSKTEESCHVGSGTGAATNHIFIDAKECSIVHREVLQEVENSSSGDLIPLSNSPMHNSRKSGLEPRKGLKRTIISSSDQVVVDSSIPDASGKTQDIAETCLSGITVSSALSPNKVAKSQLEGPHFSVVPQAIDSGLLFTPLSVSEEALLAVSSKHSQIIENQLGCATTETGNTKQLDSISPDTAAVIKNPCTENTVEHVTNTEASLTPDGLVPPVDEMVHQATPNGQGSSLSPIKTTARKRRKPQRLESSPESDCSEEEETLPTLAHIFRTSACPSEAERESSRLIEDRAREQGGSNEADGCEADAAHQRRRPPACPSPDYVESSQGSVDLFGTPDEASDVPVNDTGVSMESSQFSSEVLVTQQKVAMQEELVRLEKLMALVSEVLQEKEGGPAAKVPSDTPLINDSSKSTGPEVKDTDVQAASTLLARTPPRDKRRNKLVLVSSGLGPSEQVMVKKFAKRVGGHVVSKVTPEVTHIIMCTDGQLVCERTLKYFLGIAGRKWVVSFQWISECFKQAKLLDESPFEVRGDVVNGPDHQGPMRARTTEDSNLLMKGYKICFQGPFTDMTTDQMEWMVELCGAAVVKEPLLLNSKRKSHQLVIVQPGSESSQSKYSALRRRATVVTRGWLLDTVATYSLQNHDNYRA
ncbi:LOW QUALITY PROTEIN: uncharacterized protein ACJ7VT_005418 [Polymixia lowei]